MTRGSKAAAALAVALAGWIAWDLGAPQHHSLRDFDGHAVGRLETAMWRSYYGHHPVGLFGEMIEVLRRQYHLTFWRSCLGAYHAARAAVVFQAGHNRNEYERALPHLVEYYGLIRRSGDAEFPVVRTSELELEWWIVHRERALHSPQDLPNAMAELQAVIYRQPAARFAEHARDRAEAMLIRDAGGAAGRVSENDWSRIGMLLDSSWVSLQKVVAP